MKNFRTGGFKTPIWKVVGTDNLRPVLQYAYIDNGFVVCTNAHVLIKQSLRDFHEINSDEIENLNGKFLHRNLLIQISKYDVIEFKKDGIRCHKNGTTCIFEYSPFDDKYVNYEAVTQKFKSDKKTDILFDFRLLKTLSEAMGISRGVKLNFNKEKGYIKVEHEDCLIADNFGMIMPLMDK
jgi:hypothetical protein